MNRLIYLWELDSVRNKDVEKENGVLMSDVFKAIRHEIVKCGNSVIVTMNQLTDSSFFAQVFNDEYAYESILKLFLLGALRVSIFRDKNSKVRTASQYVQNALISFKGEENSFVFSNFPIMGSDTPEFKETVLNALKYSDLSELREMKDEYSEKDPEFAKRLGTVIKFVNIILMLSVSETANVPPKSADDPVVAKEESAIKNHPFVIYMQKILEKISLMKTDPECATLYNEHAKEIESSLIALRARMLELDGNNNAYKRSAWIYENKKKLFSGLSEEIIHIAYNYTVEDSINGVCKNFDSKDIKRDLYYRISNYYERINTPVTSSEPVKKRSFKIMLRLAEYRKNQNIERDGIYSEVFLKDRLKWKSYMIKQSLVAFFWAFIYICLFCASEMINNFLEDMLSFSVPNYFLTVLMNVVMFGLLGSLFAFLIKKINKNHDAPDILESIVDIFIHIYDLIIVMIGGKNDSKKRS